VCSSDLSGVAARAEGLWHYAARGAASRYAVAGFIVAQLGLAVPVEPCPSAAWPTRAQRPAHSTFDCTRFDRAFGLARPDWRAPLARYLETLR
jgi:dTDP-4-dehydrorhamnose reductase